MITNLVMKITEYIWIDLTKIIISIFLKNSKFNTRFPPIHEKKIIIL